MESVFPYFLAGVSSVVLALVSAVTYLYRELQVSREHERNCKEEQASMRSQIVGLNVMMEQMRGSEAGLIANIVINAKTGMIVEWAPAATMLLHWPQKERMGKSITDLIPERYRQRQQAAMQAMIAGGRAPRRGPFSLFALNRHRQEVPVEITLSGWYEGDAYLVAASVRLRQFMSEGDSNNEDNPAH